MKTNVGGPKNMPEGFGSLPESKPSFIDSCNLKPKEVNSLIRRRVPTFAFADRRYNMFGRAVQAQLLGATSCEVTAEDVHHITGTTLSVSPP